jgi:hypothetical protein
MGKITPIAKQETRYSQEARGLITTSKLDLEDPRLPSTSEISAIAKQETYYSQEARYILFPKHAQEIHLPLPKKKKQKAHHSRSAGKITTIAKQETYHSQGARDLQLPSTSKRSAITK